MSKPHIPLKKSEPNSVLLNLKRCIHCGSFEVEADEYCLPCKNYFDDYYNYEPADFEDYPDEYLPSPAEALKQIIKYIKEP